MSIQVLLKRRDPQFNIARYYVLSIEPTLFCAHTLVRNWGRTGSHGRRRLEYFENHATACIALEAWLKRKRRRGYEVV
jgi:predicted DNA-binding WGR domain protein